MKLAQSPFRCCRAGYTGLPEYLAISIPVGVYAVPVRIVVTAIISAALGTALAQPFVQSSHIAANVPDASEFERLLQRDLVAYFRSNGQANVDRVEYELLRETATQSGVSHPKYYAWVKPLAAEVALADGAVRLAAIERTKFEVTNFISRSQIQNSRASVDAVFPAALVPAIMRRASTP